MLTKLIGFRRMIGTSTFDYCFIQTCIYTLHGIAPLCAVYCILIFFLQPLPFRLPWLLEVWAFAEVLFLLLYQARAVVLQRDAIHPPILPAAERKQLFRLCHDTIQDCERYLRMWFMDASPAEIRRGNVKELYRWAILNKKEISPNDDGELEEYINQTELLLGRKLEPGYGNAKSLRITFNRLRIAYRSLLWYWAVFVVDSLSHVYLLWHSFKFYRLPLRKFPTVFPLRPLTLFNKRKSPAQTLTYWFKPHRAADRLPLLFIHGIGIGLYPYVNFLAQINEQACKGGFDEEIGIIAIEIMPVSFRITGSAKSKRQMCLEIQQILDRHGWTKYVLAAHSYGSVIASYLIRGQLSQLVGPIVLIDPVTILLHLPDVAFNFTYRKPKQANELQLHYFASTDMGVAHTLGRCFFWQEIILWKHELRGRNVTVSLSGRDLIVNTVTVARYLAGEDDLIEDQWRYRGWKGQGLDVVWFEELDHAQVFDKRKNRQKLVDIVRAYSKQTAS